MSADQDISSIDKQWEQNPQLVRRFLDQRPNYEQLCSEVAYVLRGRLSKAGIEVAAVTYRAKTLASFLDKTQRKAYKNPLSEISDFAGVRVVCLYSPDKDVVQKIIKEEFELLEEVDKLKEKSVEKFGYSAEHYVVRLGKAMSGARYDDLKDLVCEIQVRTVLQDAWAIIQHHLVYKKEADVPKTLQRKLNSLSGLLETADDQFDAVRKERSAYLKSLERSKDEPSSFLASDFNLDSFTAYLKWKYPEYKTENFAGQIKTIFGMMKKDEHPTLKELDVFVESSKSVLEEMIKEYSKRSLLFKIPAASMIVMYAVAIHNERWKSGTPNMGLISHQIIKKYNKW